MSNPTLKLIMLWAGILLTSPYVMARDCQRACTKQILCEIESDLDKLLACGSSISIDQEDIGTSGYVIDAPGNYCIDGDLTFSPAGNGIAAITIAPNVQNVNIYFNGHVLAQDPASTTLNNYGILVSESCQNISISGGTVQGFSASQIKGKYNLNSLNVSDMLLIGIPQSAGGSRIDGVTETSANGLFINGLSNLTTSSNIVVSNVEVRTIFLDIPSISNLSTYGIQMVNCNDVVLYQTITDQIEYFGPVTTGVNTCCGVFIDACSNIVCEDCKSHDNHAFTPSFNGSVTGDAFGFDFVSCDQAQCIGCSAYSNGGTRRCDGFVLVGGCNNFVFEDCQAQNNLVVDPGAPGVSSHNGFEVVGTVLGLAPCSNIIMKDCHVNGQPDCFFIIGSNNVLIQNCTATFGKTASYGPFDVGGFFLAGTTNSTIEDCIAVGFQATNAQGTGFLVENFFGLIASNNNIRRCKSVNNNYGMFIGAQPFGSGARNTIIEANEVSFNTAGGVADFSFNLTNVYIQNLAYENGTPASFAANYSGLPAGTPILTWTIGSAPSATDSNGILNPQLDNVSVIHP